MYKFYTYDAKGNDIIVTVYASSEGDAWWQFRDKYPTAPVDFVDGELL